MNAYTVQTEPIHAFSPVHSPEYLSVHPLGFLLCAASINVPSYRRVFFPQFPFNLFRSCPLELAGSTFQANSSISCGAITNFFIYITVPMKERAVLWGKVIGHQLFWLFLLFPQGILQSQKLTHNEANSMIFRGDLGQDVSKMLQPKISNGKLLHMYQIVQVHQFK